MDPPSRQHSRRARPRFRWQGALILLPVVVLAAVGVGALWRDRRDAERELRERAQTLATDLAQRLALALYPPDGDPVRRDGLPPTPLEFGPVPSRFILGPDGTLQYPRFFPVAPVPAPLELAPLSTLQSNRWTEAEGLANSNAAPILRAEAWARFLATEPPARFAGLAGYARALALEASGQRDDATAALVTLLPSSRDVVTEAGLPLLQWVQLRLLEQLPLERIRALEESSPSPPVDPRRPGFSGERPGWVLTAITEQPSLLSRQIAELADRVGLAAEARGDAMTMPSLERWRAEEDLRARVECALPHLRAATNSAASLPWMFWWECGGTNWFAYRTDVDATNAATARHVFTVGSSGAALALAERVLKQAALPAYLTPSVELAGHELLPGGRLRELVYSAGGKGGGQHWGEAAAGAPDRPVVLASGHPTQASMPLAVKLYFTSPQMFYAGLRERTLLFGLLIAASAFAAVIGFFSAKRAFNRQQRLAEMKSNFVSSVSHELRAPIASVRLMAEGLERGKIADPARQREYFRFIVQECRRLSSLIENVLDFARIEQGRKEYEFEPTDLFALVEATLQLMAPVAEERGVTLRLMLRTNDAEAWTANGRQRFELACDGQAIQQALVNLLDNAIKYSPRGATVDVRMQEFGRPAATGNAATARFVQVSVLDRGPGIPREEQERIFERFYRIGAELRRETQGVGIGLSIVKHIVEAHGGRVLVKSVPGDGSAFTMELPVEPDRERKDT